MIFRADSGRIGLDLPSADEKTLETIGASEGIRTLDIHLGKVTLYQAELRSHPVNGQIVTNQTDKGIFSRF